MFTTLPGTLFVTNSGPTTAPAFSVSSGNIKTGLADAQTDLVLSESLTSTSAGYSASSTSSGYSCVNDRRQSYFYIGQPVGTFHSDNKVQYRWQFHPYTQYYARQVSGVWKWQQEICVTGGADGQNGYRSFYNASLMAANSTNTANRIGVHYDTNGDSTAVSSLTIQASVGPVKITGSLPTSGGGTNYGGWGRAKYASHTDAFGPTQSYGGWKSGCTYSRTCGSPNMQNQVHNGLFEFSHGDYNRNFPIDAQYNLYCANPFGVGCG